MFIVCKTDCAHLYQPEKPVANQQMESVRTTKRCWNPHRRFLFSDIYDCDAGANIGILYPQKKKQVSNLKVVVMPSWPQNDLMINQISFELQWCFIWYKKNKVIKKELATEERDLNSFLKINFSHDCGNSMFCFVFSFLLGGAGAWM